MVDRELVEVLRQMTRRVPIFPKKQSQTPCGTPGTTRLISAGPRPRGGGDEQSHPRAAPGPTGTRRRGTPPSCRGPSVLRPTSSTGFHSAHTPGLPSLLVRPVLARDLSPGAGWGLPVLGRGAGQWSGPRGALLLESPVWCLAGGWGAQDHVGGEGSLGWGPLLEARRGPNPTAGAQGQSRLQTTGSSEGQGPPRPRQQLRGASPGRAGPTLA